MATAQMVREQTKSVSWSSIFPQEQVTETQSALFVKKLLAVAVSSITYLRAIFPEHAFGDRRLEDLNLKILKDDSACPGSCQVIQWIKGCFDALDKRFLRMIVIGIYTDAEDPDTVIESYTFKFTYNKDGMSIFRNGSKIASAYTEAETKKATIRLLRTIIILTQTLTSLPDDVMMTMKLLYYDEVTPTSYQPPGFKETRINTFQFQEEPMNIKVGDVATPFHTVKLRIKTEFHQFDLKEDEDEEDTAAINGDASDADEQSMKDPLSPETVSTFVENAELPSPVTSVASENNKRKHTSNSSSEQTLPGSNSSMECDIVPLENAHVPGVEESAASMSVASTPVSEGEKQKDDDGPNVDCSCTYNEDDGLMIMCEMCHTWQHAVCYGILEEEEAPDLHVCAVCSKQKGATKCTDPSLTDLIPVVLQSTCLWRRALSACTEMNRILPTTLSRRLGIEMTVAQGLINRLEREGFIRSALKGKRLGKIVNKAKLKVQDLKSYINNEVDNREKTRELMSSVDKKDGSSMDTITEKASNMDVSGKLRSRKTKDNQQSSNKTKADNPKQKSSKRVISTVDGYNEFDISDSQEPTHTDEEPARKRKASIANKSILV